MAEVSDPPREIGQEDETVAKKTDGMIDVRVIGQVIMASL